MATFTNLAPGDPAPRFVQASYANPRYAFDTAAGRYLVLCFFGSAGAPHSRAALAAVAARRDFFDDVTASFFGISMDPGDQSGKRVADSYPGYRYLWDFDWSVGTLYGAVQKDAPGNGGPPLIRRLWVVVDPTLRVLHVVPFRQDGSDIEDVMARLDALPPPDRFAGFELQAPIIVLPNVFDQALCDRLIARYKAHGGDDSGFMRDVDGKTVLVMDYGHKRRRDFNIEDKALIAELQGLFHRRVVPEIARIHQFNVTRMERYIVACYSAEERAHFRAHRDNTTKGTAHRRFAVSVNLNDDFDGGEVCFPEYGRRGFKPSAGGAIVFTCSLLHAVTPVTRGRRYAFLPFLYDDAAAAIRAQNNRFLGDGVVSYQGSTQIE